MGEMQFVSERKQIALITDWKIQEGIFHYIARQNAQE